MTVHDEFRSILVAAQHFSIGGGPEMEMREAALASAADQISRWLTSSELTDALGELQLRVDRGGRQANFAPVPWIRIFSQAHSPRSTEGFYLVYLFGGDGRSVYLSLNQGTSEFRSRQMRPIRDPAEIAARSAMARWRFEGSIARPARNGETRIQLGVDSMDVGSESKLRVRNYEAGSVFALRYAVDDVPDDANLRADLVDFIPLLLDLHAEPLAASDPGPARVRETEQRYVSDTRVRVAIEHRAMTAAEDHFSKLGYRVEDVSGRESYDIRCTAANSSELHVEVKGTTGLGQQVFLTRNEVRHASEFPDCALAIVSEIEIVADESEIIGIGGRLRVLDPWSLDSNDLSPVQYVYRVPLIDG